MPKHTVIGSRNKLTPATWQSPSKSLTSDCHARKTTRLAMTVPGGGKYTPIGSQFLHLPRSADSQIASAPRTSCL